MYSWRKQNESEKNTGRLRIHARQDKTLILGRQFRPKSVIFVRHLGGKTLFHLNLEQATPSSVEHAEHACTLSMVQAHSAVLQFSYHMFTDSIVVIYCLFPAQLLLV